MEISLKTLKKIGLPFSGWHVVREIGSGTFGCVFRIENTRGDVCALKVIPVPYSESVMEDAMQSYGDVELARSSFDEQVKMILTREIGTAKQCASCRNIFRIFEEAVVDDPDNRAQRYIMVRMELLTELKPYMNTPGKTQRDVLELMENIGTALAFLERKNIIHRDIKPANIMVDSQGYYKLTDFGEARVTRWEGSHTISRGTPYYMAPEVSNSSHYDHRADIYSLGIVAYYLLNRMSYPFSQNGFASHEGYRKRMNGETCPSIPGVDPMINRVVLRCIAYRPEDRYANASELLRNLKELLKDRSMGLVELSTGRAVGGEARTPSKDKDSERTPVRKRGSNSRGGRSDGNGGDSGRRGGSGRFGPDGREIDNAGPEGNGGSGRHGNGGGSGQRGGSSGQRGNGSGSENIGSTHRMRFGPDGREIDDGESEGNGSSGRHGGNGGGEHVAHGGEGGASGGDAGQSRETESGSGKGSLSTTALVLIVVGAVMLFMIIVAVIASSATRNISGIQAYTPAITEPANTIGPIGGN